MRKLILLIAMLCPVASWAADAICGVDTDHSGIGSFAGQADTYCPGNDADKDSFTVAEGDCDDNDHFTFPNPIRYVTTGCTGGQVRKCNEDGTGWSACAAWSCSLVSSTNTCRYVSAADGSNTYDGTSPTFVSGTTGPWATTEMFSTRAGASPPAGRRTPIKGDAYILLNGTYPHYLTGAGVPEILTIDKSCTPGPACSNLGTADDPIVVTAYPGHRPKLYYDGSVLASDDNMASPEVYVEDSPHTWISGLDMDGTHVRIARAGNDTTGFKLLATRIYNYDGNVDNNTACVSLGLSDNESDISIIGNEFFDCYDRQDIDDGIISAGADPNDANDQDGPDSGWPNNTKIVIFRGNSNTIVLAGNHMADTDKDTGICIKKKHASGDSGDQLQVTDNVCYRAHSEVSASAWQFSGAVYAARNYISGLDPDVGCLSLTNLGGTTNFRGTTLIENNTVVGCALLDLKPNLEFDETGSASCTSPCATPGTITLRDNVFDSATSSGTMVSFCHNGSNTYFTELNGKLTYENNVFCTPSISFAASFFGENSGNTSGSGDAACFDAAGESRSSGSTFADLTAWNAGSIAEGDMDFASCTYDSYGRVTNTGAGDAGWIPINDSTSVPASGRSSVRVLRRGRD